MSPFAQAKRHWHLFKRDQPGHRFAHQHERLRENGMGVKIALAVGGVLLLVAGIVLCFIPGPGIPLLVFGLALLAGLSRSLARTLDRAEPVLRHQAKQLRGRWHGLSGGAQVLMCALVVVALAAVGVGAYRVISS
jgi:hypothetical protein